MRIRLAAALAATLVVVAGCGRAPLTGAPQTSPTTQAPPASTTTTSPAEAPPDVSPVGDLIPQTGVARLVPEVVATTPHDPAAFTQGLEHHDGVLLESTGLYGQSDRRRVDPATGEVLARVALPMDHFGEGLTVVDDRLVQLTWLEGVAHLADPATLEASGVLPLPGEGWGVCFDGERLFLSNGTSALQTLDPATLEVTGHLPVTLDGMPLDSLNELECADGLVWANRWLFTDIVAIEPDTGEVRAVVDAASLVPPGLGEEAVLNGIARNPSSDTFWLTGKLWPVLYEVRLAQAR